MGPRGVPQFNEEVLVLHRALPIDYNNAQQKEDVEDAGTQMKWLHHATSM